MSLTKLSLAGKNLNIPGQGEFGCDIPAGDGKTLYPFLQCTGIVVERTYWTISSLTVFLQFQPHNIQPNCNTIFFYSCLICVPDGEFPSQLCAFLTQCMTSSTVIFPPLPVFASQTEKFLRHFTHFWPIGIKTSSTVIFPSLVVFVFQTENFLLSNAHFWLNDITCNQTVLFPPKLNHSCHNCKQTIFSKPYHFCFNHHFCLSGSLPSKMYNIHPNTFVSTIILPQSYSLHPYHILAILNHDTTVSCLSITFVSMSNVSFPYPQNYFRHSHFIFGPTE